MPSPDSEIPEEGDTALEKGEDIREEHHEMSNPGDEGKEEKVEKFSEHHVDGMSMSDVEVKNNVYVSDTGQFEGGTDEGNLSGQDDNETMSEKIIGQ